MYKSEQFESSQATTFILLLYSRSTLSEEPDRDTNSALDMKPLKHREYHDTRAN